MKGGQRRSLINVPKREQKRYYLEVLSTTIMFDTCEIKQTDGRETRRYTKLTVEKHGCTMKLKKQLKITAR